MAQPPDLLFEMFEVEHCMAAIEAERNPETMTRAAFRLLQEMRGEEVDEGAPDVIDESWLMQFSETIDG